MMSNHSSQSAHIGSGLAIIIAILLGLSGASPAFGQASIQIHQPLDVMLVIDNSGSMFPPDQTCFGCESGNDPQFLRLTGASLFIAGLGLGESNSKDYQVGVISLGDARPELISPLRSAPEVRDTLAKAINAPTPKATTYLIPALKLAYAQLKDAPQRRPGNQPAVVVLTDGEPYPSAGQSQSDIQKLVEAYPDVPLFFILLQNPAKKSDTLENYTRFWEGMQRRNDQVRTYRANNTSEITRTFDEIIARLQNSIPEPGGGTVGPEKPVNVYVSKYVQGMSVKVIHTRGGSKAEVTITDPRGVTVRSDDPQVEWFRGNDNQVETIAIGSTRLDQAPRNDIWTIRSSSQVSYQLVRTGAYDFQFVQPQVGATSVKGQYLALNRFSPTRPMIIQFKLLLNKSLEPVTEPQEISGRILRPDGSTSDLRIPVGIKPNTEGVYEISYDFATDYPAAARTPGRFMLTINAGINDPNSQIRVPIARADLLVDVGRMADIDKVSPDPLVCAAGQSTNLSVTIRDADVAKADSLHVRVYFGSGRDIELKPAGGSVFGGSVDALCQAFVPTVTCDQKREDKVRIRFVSENRDGSAAPPAEYSLPVQIVGPRCTPTPTYTPVPPTATPRPPTPTPTPTPKPSNRDGDPLIDSVDRCPDAAEWSAAPWFEGCPPPLWALILTGLGSLGLLAFLALYLLPLLLTLTILPPPSGHMLVLRDNKAQGSPVSIRNAGIGARRSKVTIGSKGHIRIAGLEPVELRVERRGKEAIVMEGSNGPQKLVIGEFPKQLVTSDASIILKFSTKSAKLK